MVIWFLFKKYYKEDKMKVFISADMEGITGVVQFEQVLPGKEGYKQARETDGRRCQCSH